jgi:hypothetical protein
MRDENPSTEPTSLDMLPFDQVFETAHRYRKQIGGIFLRIQKSAGGEMKFCMAAS